MIPFMRLKLLIRSCLQIFNKEVEYYYPGLRPYAIRNYASVKKAQTQKEDKSFIDMDTEKLCSYVCINHFVEAKEPGPKILPDDQYPAWLFELDLKKKRALEDLDPEVDGWAYWRALRKRQNQQNQRFRKLRLKFLHLQNSPSMRKSQGLSNKPGALK